MVLFDGNAHFVGRAELEESRYSGSNHAIERVAKNAPLTAALIRKAMKKNNDNIEVELIFEEAVVLHEFMKRQLMKSRFAGDKAEKAAALSLFTNLSSHLAGYSLLNDAAWKIDVAKAKKYMTNFDLQVAKAKRLAKAYKKR